MGETTIDLEYGASKMPRTILVDGAGKIVYLGHPKKIKMQEALDILGKNEKLELDPLLLKEDDYSAPQPIQAIPNLATEIGSDSVYREDLNIETVRDEMAKFVIALKDAANLGKEAVKTLETDFLLIHRDTKVENGIFVTKY